MEYDKLYLLPLKQEINLFAGWGGDLTTFASDVYKNTEGVTDKSEIVNIAKRIICNPKYNTTFGLEDYIGDLDAVNIGTLLRKYSFSSLFQDYFLTNAATNCFKRSTLYIETDFKGDINKFYETCNTINEAKFPYSIFRKLLNKLPLEQVHYDAANEAFKDFVTNEVKNNR